LLSDTYCPVNIACSKGLFEFVKALLRAGADPLAKDSASFTPLHWASLTNDALDLDLALIAPCQI
jgi:ankyrin repeat protein